AVHEFPTDLFTNKERAEGAVALHVFCAIYMFCALAVVCDDYFVPSLEKLCERLHLSEDVAGATFMAAGSSAPELFTSIIGVFITKGDVGVGTIVGSAVFNILCIIGVCGFFAGQAVKLSRWAVLRDSIYYTFSVTALIVFIYDENVCWWESLILILMYAVYILIMKFNGKVQRYFDRRKKTSLNLTNGLTGSTDLEDNVTCDATAVLLKKANFHCQPSVLMVDELLSAYPHQLTFSEAGMRIMITSHFSPRTRLTMASRMLINERQRLINTTETRVNVLTNGDSDSAASPTGRRGCDNGPAVTERGLNGRCPLQRLHSGNETENESDDNENKTEAEGEDGGNGPMVPFRVPAGVCSKLKWLVMWPLSLLLFYTVPNCGKRRWERWFLVSFFTATIWIAGLSYIMVWMVTVIGFTLGIPDVIMGITFLAAGTSVPDCMASVIVARQGMRRPTPPRSHTSVISWLCTDLDGAAVVAPGLGDMAISNSIGSNVFDILVGLGLPWMLQTLCIDYGSNVSGASIGWICAHVLLLSMFCSVLSFLQVLGVHLNKWTLDWRLGLACIILYAVFLCFSILIEFNVFIFVNLPMCRD
ncbi:unnamed protein product, partial [Tetraodon nigroviridis]